MARAADRNLLRGIYILMKEGLTTTEIGERFNMSQVAVSQVAQKKNLNIAMKMMELADEGQSLEEIGRSFRVSKQRVQQLIGRAPKVGSTGKSVSIDAAPASWIALLGALDKVDIPIRYKMSGTDTRAIAIFLDGLRSGEYQIVRSGDQPVKG